MKIYKSPIHSYLPWLILGSLLLMQSGICIAQDKEEISKYILELKSQYSDESFASINSLKQISFHLDEATQQIGVQQKTSHQFVMLKPSSTVVYVLNYDDQSNIDHVKIKDSMNRKVRPNTLCGYRQDDGIFYSDAQFCGYEFTKPSGTNWMRFESKMNYQDVRYFTKFYFHDLFPVVKQRIEVNVPSWLDIELYEINFEGYDVKKEVIPEANSQLITYELTEISPSSKEASAPSAPKLYPHCLVVAKSFHQNGQERPLMRNTQDLYDWYQNLVSGVKNDHSKLTDLVSGLTDNVASDLVKIENIFQWVQKNIKYLAFEDGLAGFKPEDAQTVYYNKYGDCKGMANLIKQMLVIAGFDARLTWIGTNHLPYTYDIPSLAVDNHMICTLSQNDRRFILDATDKYLPFGMTPNHLVGKQMLIENGNTYLIDTVLSQHYDQNLSQYTYKAVLSEEELVGEGVWKVSGAYNKILMKSLDLTKQSEEVNSIKKMISNTLDKDDLSMDSIPKFNYKPSNTVGFNFRTKDMVTHFDDEYYLDLNFVKSLSRSVIKKDRKLPMELDWNWHRVSKVSLHLPDNFSIAYSPTTIEIDNDLLKAKLGYSIQEGEILLENDIYVKKTRINPNEFGQWNESIRIISDFYDDQLIVKKK